jgi:F-type H+-transporting ATPase subunit a
MMEFEVPKFRNKSIILCAIPSLIVLFNYFGLVPFSIPLRAHMEFFMIFSFMVVLTIVIRNFFFNPYNFFIHFIPFSCPLVLSVFLFLIEVIRLFIRPITLALRLGANITSGHIILGMTMSTIVLTPFFYFFEVFVCLIQRYIFVTLVRVYSQEHSV